MKTLLHRLTSAALMLAAPLLFAAGAQAGEITLYTHANFGGASVTLRNTTPDLVPLGFNDRTSSVVVRSGAWELCEHADFRGRCVVLERGEYPVLEGFNDQVSSAREVAGRGRDYRDGRDDRDNRGDNRDYRGGERDGRHGWRDDDRGYGRRGEPIILYSHAGFSGAKVELHNDVVRTLTDYDFNDQTGSIIVNEGRWQLCEHADFGGRCIVLEPGRYEQLDNMNDRISSLRRLR
ncbi:beta/gamma crystallin family protein [Duganella sp. LjRoot269]|uniref:beta/gamma crystallin family protein n=1 Tax=Duganella sp. LjRoot269 TaxID=3342305 RepID=UPI003ED05DDD